MTMTLREQWFENRRRRLAGLPEVDREGVEYKKRELETDTRTPEQKEAAGIRMGEEILAYYAHSHRPGD
jgi:hypothetical protein